jgi:hypothetical protein
VLAFVVNGVGFVRLAVAPGYRDTADRFLDGDSGWSKIAPTASSITSAPLPLGPRREFQVTLRSSMAPEAPAHATPRNR